MDRTFRYSFEPRSEDPVGGTTISLAVQEIEDAGLLEVLQMPGAKLGSWEFLDGLLLPTGAGSPFVFRSPLGNAREVKVALSGLFGRFVARAYLQRYFNKTFFSHVAAGTLLKVNRQTFAIKRLNRGDLPDWICWEADSTGLMVAEAKGSHDAAGPDKSLGRAWEQVNRVAILVGKRRFTVKRLAISTRWSSGTSGTHPPMLSVHDPEDVGDQVTEAETKALYLALTRIHYANLLNGLGLYKLAGTLRAWNAADVDDFPTYSEVVTRELNDVGIRRISDPDQQNLLGPLVGGFVTRQGVLPEQVLSADDQATLDRLGLRPQFVGVERKVLEALVQSDVQALRSRLANIDRQRKTIRADGSGVWIVPVGERSQMVD